MSRSGGTLQGTITYPTLVKGKSPSKVSAGRGYVSSQGNQSKVTTNFRYLKWRYILNLIRLFWGWGVTHISLNIQLI